MKKKKALIMKIKTDLDQVEIPDYKAEIITKYQESLTNEVILNDEVIVNKPRKANKLAFPKLALQFSLLAIIIFLVALPFFHNTPAPITPPTDLSKPKKAYALQAISLFNYATTLTDNQRATRSISKQASINYQTMANQVHKYYLLVEDLFNKELVEYDLEILEDGLYTYKVEIVIPLLVDNTVYTLYFNEYAERDGDIDEISSRLEGIILQDGVQYRLTGQKVIENDECEIELKLFLSADETDYLEVSQEVEHNENEYEYQYYINNELVQEFSVSVEVKNGHKTIELEILNANIKEEYEFSYYNSYILVEYEYDDIEGTVKITETNNTYEYYFEEEKQTVIKNK